MTGPAALRGHATNMKISVRNGGAPLSAGFGWDDGNPTRRRLRARSVCALVVSTLILGPPVTGAAEEGHGSNRRYSIEQEGGQAWLVDPNGSRFFSLGVCCVNQGASPTDWDPANPAYAAWRHYGSSNAWAAATLKRLKAWGFTTVGGWSDFQTLNGCSEADLAFAPVLHIGATAGVPWWDMWDPKTVERMEEVARVHILPWRNDPRLLGYYTDNELSWWNTALFRATLEQAPTSGQRRRLIQLLRETYHNSWAELMRDFEPATPLEDWEQLEHHGTLNPRPGGKGIRVERQFLGILAQRYYSLVHDLVRKYDPQALILGDRFPSFYYPEVVRAAGPFVDALSCNYRSPWNDGSIPRFFLDTLHELGGKPLIIGEFYMSARQNRSGNKNTHGTFPVVSTQNERADGFRRTLLRFLDSPYVIGADWFQYHDEPTHGRSDGENFNFGLVDLHDRPYKPLVSTAAALDPTRRKRPSPRDRPDASHGVPPAPRDPFAAFEHGLALKHWDRERGFVKPASELPLADLYICWDRRAVYLGLCAQDVVEDSFYRGKTVLASERAEWSISIPGRPEPVRGRIGAGMEPVFDEPSVQAAHLSGLNGHVWDIACVRLPAKLFGKPRFRAGDSVELASIFHAHCGAYRVEWKASLTLRRNP